MKTNQWLKPFLFTLLILVAPIVAYYVYFVEARETFLLERFHAHLANTAARMEARFSSAFDVIKNNPNQRNELGVGMCSKPSAAPPADRPSATATAAGSPAPTDPPPQEFVSRAAAGKLAFHTKGCEAAVDIDTLVGNVDPERQFYDVVIFDEQDNVVFQRDAENGRITGGQLITRAAEKSAADSKSTVKDPLVDMRRSYQGRPFLIFAQPIDIQIAARDKGSWKIVGLLGETEFTRLKYSVGPGGIALVALIVLGVLLAGPFLKLRYLGRFERLSRFDIFLQAGAGLSLIAMATVAWLAWNTDVRLATYFDRRLAAIAKDLVQAVDEEFRMAATTLGRLEPLMIRSYETRLAHATATWGDADCPTIAGPGKEPSEDIPTAAGDILDKRKAETRDYRQLSMAYLMDQKGCQLVKWSSEETWPRPGRFADRAYFTRALPDERFPLNLYGTEPPVFQEVVVSRTTGERQIVFSKPVVDAGKCADAIPDSARDPSRVPCVSVINASVRALESVLPSGFFVMLLNTDSDIVWRSDGDTSTELNLAKEIDEPERLRTVVRLAIEAPDRDGEWFDADYHRKPHRFLVVPLPIGRLALAAFYNRNLVTATVLESAGAAGTAWLIWMTVLTTLLFTLWIVDDVTEHSLRQWPLCLTIVLPAVFAAGWIALAVPRMLLWAAAGTALSLIPLFFLAGQDSARINAQWRRALVVFPTWFAVMLAASVPMRVLYDQAELASLSALVRFESSEYNHDLTLQAESFERWKHKVGLAKESDWKGFAAWRNDERFLSPQDDPDGSVSLSGCGLFDTVCRILTSLPDYSADVSGVHAMHRQNGRPNADVREMLLHDAPATYAFHPFVAGLAALLSLAAVWYLLVRTFGLRAENVVEVSSTAVPTGTEAAHHIVYGVPARERRQYLEGLEGAKLWLDLRDASPDTRIDVLRSTDVIAIDEFDSSLNDVAVVRQRVELLERLLREGHRVILLFVSTDPLNFVTAQYDPEEHAALLSRFATALSRFKFTYHAGVVERPVQADGSLATRVLAALRRMSAPSERQGWRERLVAFECRHPDLWEIRDDLRAEVETQEWSKGQIVQQVQSRANAIYQHMWSKCTRVEKFTLIELALGNPMNPNNWDAARRLRVRGLVRATPFYRIANESLRQFVARMERVEDVQRWRAENPGAWDQIKVPFIVLLLGVVVFVAVTQPALFNSLFAFVAAGVATFPFLVNALNARLQRSSSASAK